ncbi:NACHT and ankyrin domain protein [Podospora conica]|nr:NACHT and ankyrin domain protein [Schizothecium conicum]
MSVPNRKRHASSSSIPLTEQPRHDKRQRVPLTCEWILDEPLYKSWKSWDETLPSTLWIQGPAGAGKSVLARFISDELGGSDDKSVVMSCYCDAASTPASILRTALTQLLASTSATEELHGRLSTALELVDQTPPPASPPSDPSYRAWDRFVEVIEACPPITLIVDGLDELSNKYLATHEFDMPGRLVDLTGVPAGCVRLLVLSRPQPSIQKALASSLRLTVTREKTQHDLERFVDHSISQLPALAALSPPTKTKLAAEIVRRSEGIFIWASLCLQQLAKAPVDDTDGLLERLDSLPPTLNEVYAELLERQEKSLTSSELAVRDAALAWSCAAVRPLLTIEFANILAVERGQFLPSPDDQILNVCGSLAKIEHGLVLPMHHSLREFLRSVQIDKTPSLSVYHLTAAKTLLSYLCHPALRHVKDLASDGNFEQSHPLVEYATLYWVYHCSQADADPDLQDEILSFFQSPNASVWFDVLLPHMIHRSVLPVPPRPPINARFCHLMSLKAQLANYFGKERKNDIDAEISASLRSEYENLLEEATTTHGEHSAIRLRRLLELAELYSWLPGCQERAIDLLTEAITVASELSSPEADELRLTAYQALADEYKRRANFEDAAKLLEKILETAEGGRKMFALDSLGWVSARIGKLDAAEKYLKEALEIAQAEHGSASPYTLRSKVTLAEVLSKLGRHGEAEELCAALEAQVSSHRLEGVPLPKDSMSHLNILASVYVQQGKLAEARGLYELIVGDRRAVFGDNHRLTLWAEMQLGVVMVKTGEEDEGRRVLKNLLPRQIAVLGSEHPDVAQVGDILDQNSEQNPGTHENLVPPPNFFHQASKVFNLLISEAKPAILSRSQAFAQRVTPQVLKENKLATTTNMPLYFNSPATKINLKFLHRVDVFELAFKLVMAMDKSAANPNREELVKSTAVMSDIVERFNATVRETSVPSSATEEEKIRADEDRLRALNDMMGTQERFFLQVFGEVGKRALEDAERLSPQMTPAMLEGLEGLEGV